jgi:hypothetical protein
MSIRFTRRGRSGSPDYVYTATHFHRQAHCRRFSATQFKSSIAYQLGMSMEPNTASGLLFSPADQILNTVGLHLAYSRKTAGSSNPPSNPNGYVA